jgi:hypothetical protein
MKTSLSLLLALALIMGPVTVAAQTERTQRLADVCHFLGKWAEQAATARTVGIPVSRLLDTVHNPAKMAQMPAAERQMFAVLAAELERVTLAVYASDLSPNNAYLTYRLQCQAAALER